MFFPNYKFNSITDITIDFLIDNNIEMLLLDMDNTLGKYEDAFPPKSIIDWVNYIKKSGIFLMIMTNNKNKERVINYEKSLSIAVWMNARKPLKSEFNSLLYNTGYYDSRNNVAIVGDNRFTDILGGNRSKILTILVKKNKIIKNKIENKRDDTNISVISFLIKNFYQIY